MRVATQRVKTHALTEHGMRQVHTVSGAAESALIPVATVLPVPTAHRHYNHWLLSRDKKRHVAPSRSRTP